MSFRLPEERRPLCRWVVCAKHTLFLRLIKTGVDLSMWFPDVSSSAVWKNLLLCDPTALFFPADRDECALTHYCMHRCVNTQGSYYCECNAGHKLASNNHSCVGKSPKGTRTYVLTSTTLNCKNIFPSGLCLLVAACNTCCVAVVRLTFHWSGNLLWIKQLITEVIRR